MVFAFGTVNVLLLPIPVSLFTKFINSQRFWRQSNPQLARSKMAATLDGFAVVPGAGSGIGRDCALAYAVAGAAGVVFADINIEAAKEAAAESRGRGPHPSYKAIAVAVDVTKEENVSSLMDQAVSEFGRIDYAVNSAGIGVKAPAEIADASLAEFEQFFDVNVKGTLLFCKYATQAMKKQEPRTCQGCAAERDLGRGVIINIGSLNSYVPVPGIVQYTAAKHALFGITKSAAIDNAPYNIRVNAICPAWVKTKMVDEAFAANPALNEMVKKAVPMGRIALQEEVSDLAIFLSGRGGSYVTGQGWIVDGGTSLQMRT
ncbi:hypothetical protein ABVK25_012080 [Lepraria finkii]|uniref:Uncharacterized protein n=1 Tax=Lepraria finkii TaxID=1340010 RepID=A0ABR4AIZ7_9LECA